MLIILYSSLPQSPLSSRCLTGYRGSSREPISVTATGDPAKAHRVSRATPRDPRDTPKRAPADTPGGATSRAGEISRDSADNSARESPLRAPLHT